MMEWMACSFSPIIDSFELHKNTMKLWNKQKLPKTNLAMCIPNYLEILPEYR